MKREVHHSGEYTFIDEIDDQGRIKQQRMIKGERLVSAHIFSYKGAEYNTYMVTTLGADSKPTSVTHFAGELPIRIDEVQDRKIIKQRFLEYDGKELVRTRVVDLSSGEEEIFDEAKPESLLQTIEGQYAFPLPESDPRKDTSRELVSRAKGIAQYLRNADAKRQALTDEERNNRKLEEEPSSPETGF